MTPADTVVGQDVAVDALRFGLETSAPGQNVFVRGLTGTGRATLVRRLLETIRPDCPLPFDRAYVYNFAQPDRPRLLSLPRSQGETFRRRMDAFITFLRDDFAKALGSDVVKARSADIERQAGADMKEIARPFEAELRTAGLTMLMIQAGAVSRQIIAPLIDDEPAPPERMESLRREGKITDEQIEELAEKIGAFTDRMQAVGKGMQEIQARRIASLNELIQREAPGARRWRSRFAPQGLRGRRYQCVPGRRRRGLAHTSAGRAGRGRGLHGALPRQRRAQAHER